jgi:hypothetical protein
MKNIRNFLLFTFLLSAILALQVNAQLLVEDFDFTGDLTANGWTAHSGAGTNPIATTTGLSYTGYASSGIGNAAGLDNTGEDVNRTFTTQTSGIMYYSALVNVTNASAGWFLHLGKGGQFYIICCKSVLFNPLQLQVKLILDYQILILVHIQQRILILYNIPNHS